MQVARKGNQTSYGGQSGGAGGMRAGELVGPGGMRGGEREGECVGELVGSGSMRGGEREGERGGELVGSGGMRGDEREGERGDERGGERGGFTLEFAIVFTLVFLASCLMAYVAAMMYERAAAQASTGFAAISASAAWYDGEGAALRRGLYFRMQREEVTEKLSAAARVAEQRFGATSLPGMTAAEASAALRSGLLSKSVSVGMGGETTLPERRVPGGFGLGSVFGSSAGVASIVPDAPDAIRKIDFAIDIERMLEEESPAFKRFAGSFREANEKIRGVIGGALDG